MVEGYLPNNPACSWYRHCIFWCRHCMLPASCPRKRTVQTPTSLGLSAPWRVVSTGSPDMETTCFSLHEQERCQGTLYVPVYQPRFSFALMVILHGPSTWALCVPCFPTTVTSQIPLHAYPPGLTHLHIWRLSPDCQKTGLALAEAI